MMFIRSCVVCSPVRVLALALGFSFLLSQNTEAHPYASGVTNVGGTTIQFILNEDADNVGVSFDLGTATNNLGPLTRGTQSFPLSSHTNFMIYVAKGGSGSPTQISPVPTTGTPSTNLDFFGSRGVAINNNPQRPTFGRIYVGNANGGTDPGLRTTGKGIYALNADYSDALGYGTNAKPDKASFPSAGVQWWGSSTTYAPFRLHVGPDDTVYVGDSSGSGAANGTAGCPVWMIDPALTTPIKMFTYSGVNGGNSGNAGPCHSRPFMTGSLAQGNLTLTCMMWNYQAPGGGTYQSVLRYPINSGPINSSTVWGGNPTIVVTNAQPGFNTVGGINTVTCDLYIHPTSNYVYVMFDRSNTGGIASGNNELWVFDNNVPANVLWASSDPATGGNGTIVDCFQAVTVQPRGIAISPDGKYLGLGNLAAANYCIVKLTNGIPDISSIATYPAPAAGQRGVAFDMADNFYTTEGSSDSLRVYSLGLSTTCITSNDVTCTNGSFTIVTPATSVSVVASTNVIFEADGLPATFTITRTNANLDYTGTLPVNFTISGTATLGGANADYTIAAGATSTNVVLLPGQTSTNITITPINDTVPELTESIILSIKGGAAYSAAPPSTAEIDIVDDETPQLRIISLSTNVFQGNPNDYARLALVRYGDTNQQVNLDFPSFNMGGSAVSNVDYYLTNLPLTIEFGVVTQRFNVLYPIPGNPAVGSRSILLTNVAATGYTVTNNTASTTLVLEGTPPGTVLFSDNFENADDATNWVVLFATTTNGVTPADFTYAFNYDYSQIQGGAGNFGSMNGQPAGPLGPVGLFNILPPAPHSASGDTHGLFMTVNKNDATPAAAALNLYPILTNYNPNLTNFGGNYALRFDMFLVENITSGTTEYDIFGINHSGTLTNWFRSSGTGFDLGTTLDGLFVDIEADGANVGPGNLALGDYVLNSSPVVTNSIAVRVPKSLAARQASTLTGVFKSPPYTVGAIGGGVPSNLGGNSPTASWAEVEISQVGSLITLKVNNMVIFTYTNTTTPGSYTNGNIMLGYEDAFDSIGDGGAGSGPAAVVYDNVRVVTITPVTIAGPTNVIAGVGTNVTFAVTAATTTGVTNYQWSLNGNVIAGATTSSLNFKVAPTNFGTYSIQVDDGAYPTVASATLLPPPPVFITFPTNKVVAVNTAVANAALVVTYSGVTNYQWQLFATNVPAATTNPYNFTVTSAKYGPYRLALSDGWNPTTNSGVANITPPAPSIVQSPTSRAAVVGSSPSFSVLGSTQSGVTNYQWQFTNFGTGTFTNIVGRTATALTLTNVPIGSFGPYRALVNDGTTSLTSSVANLTVAVSPNITAPSLIPAGFKLTFTTEVGPNYVVDFSASLNSPITWTPLRTNAGTGSVITVTNTAAGANGFYRIRLQ